ncbi:MAG: S9 family peptidase [Actinomycetota bacterium]
MRPPQAPDPSPGAPWRRRFEVTHLYGFEIAAGDRSRGMLLHDGSGTAQAHSVDLRTGEMRQLTHAPTGTVMVHPMPDGSAVFLADEGGEEVGHWHRAPWDGSAPEDLTPSMPAYSSWTIGVARDGSRLAFAAVGQEGTSLYVVELGPGAPPAPRLLVTVPGLAMSLVFSADAATLCCESSGPTGSNTYALVAYDVATGRERGSLWDGPPSSVGTPVASPVRGDERVALTSNVSGRARPVLWDVATGERRDLPMPGGGDVAVLDWSEDGRFLLLGDTDRAEDTLYRYDLRTNDATSVDHGGGSFVFGGAAFTDTGSIVALRSRATEPTELVELTEGGERVVVGDPGAPPGRPWRTVSFPSTDGTPIQGWLCVPEGEGPFPTILEVHGGPESARMERYAPEVLAYVDHGYAVFCLNYRGSITFGREYQQAIWGDVGRWEIEDMAAAAAWLVEQGIAEPGGIVPAGASYGGYLTLLSLGMRPELWAAGVGEVAVADWVGMYEGSADTLRAYQDQLFGGSPEQEPDLYRRASPITYVEDVAAPLLVFQGSNDTRCPPAQLRAYEQRARAAGKDIEVVWFEAGHIGPDRSQQVAQQERALAFVHDVFDGGRG